MTPKQAEEYISKEIEYLLILKEIAESGMIAPVLWVGLLEAIPGFDIDKAPGIKNQLFDGKGFPVDVQTEQEE